MNRSASIDFLALGTCLLLLGLPSMSFGYPAPPPKTGQTFSYSSGDDGALQKGVAWPNPRFIRLVSAVEDNGGGGGVADNGICDGQEMCDGTVKDQLTGLIWLANADCFGKQTLVDALASANSLASGQCGLNDGSRSGDWRLPNINELRSLIFYGCFRPALPDRSGTGCFSADRDPVFSSVSVLYQTSTHHSGSFRWLMYGSDGRSIPAMGDGPASSWFVKGGR